MLKTVFKNKIKLKKKKVLKVQKKKIKLVKDFKKKKQKQKKTVGQGKMETFDITLFHNFYNVVSYVKMNSLNRHIAIHNLY